MKINVDILKCGRNIDDWFDVWFNLTFFDTNYDIIMEIGKLVDADGRYPIYDIRRSIGDFKPALIELLENARDIIIKKLDSDFNFEQSFTIEVDDDIYTNAKNEMEVRK